MKKKEILETSTKKKIIIDSNNSFRIVNNNVACDNIGICFQHKSVLEIEINNIDIKFPIDIYIFIIDSDIGYNKELVFMEFIDLPIIKCSISKKLPIFDESCNPSINPNYGSFDALFLDKKNYEILNEHIIMRMRETMSGQYKCTYLENSFANKKFNIVGKYSDSKIEEMINIREIVITKSTITSYDNEKSWVLNLDDNYIAINRNVPSTFKDFVCRKNIKKIMKKLGINNKVLELTNEIELLKNEIEKIKNEMKQHTCKTD